MKFINLQNKIFGRWTVVERRGKIRKEPAWFCRCDCGNEKVISGTVLREGQSKSCGCFRSEKLTKHGMSYSRTYRIWKYMVQRCTNPKTARYKDYGGRITVCERWLKFENFLEDMGECPNGLTLDRIENNQGYYKENCRWATNEQQSFNKRNTIKIFYNGKGWCRTELAKQFNLRPETLKNRLDRGMSIEEALNTPLPKQSRKIKCNKNSDELSFPIKNTNLLWKFVNA
jgi:hypothetical protein